MKSASTVGNYGSFSFPHLLSHSSDTGALYTDYSFTYIFCECFTPLRLVDVASDEVKAEKLTLSHLLVLDLDGTIETHVSASGYIQSAYYAKK